ncbi:unnamed protein product [Cunninghamella echinulata]
MFAKQLISITLVLLVIFQFVNASVFSQLQFIKINSPKMVLLMKLKSVSMGRATSLKINFHKRSGDKLQNQLAAVSKSCPVSAKQDKFVTHTTTWTVPKNLKPGSYAFAFKEQVRVRSGTLNVQEIIKFSVVEK